MSSTQLSALVAATKVAVVALFLSGLVMTFFAYPPHTQSVGWWVYAGLTAALILVPPILVAKGFKSYEETERSVIQVLGRFSRVAGPGPVILFPGLEEEHRVIRTWELQLPIITTPTEFNLKTGSSTTAGGGTVVLNNTTATVQVLSPDAKYPATLDSEGEEQKSGVFRACYVVADWRVAGAKIIYDTLREIVEAYTDDEVFQHQMAGFDLGELHSSGEFANLPQLARQKLAELERVWERWGFRLVRITSQQLTRPESVLKARKEREQMETAAETAQHAALRDARSDMGAFVARLAAASGQKVSDVQRQLQENPDLRQRMMDHAHEYTTRQMSASAKALTDIRTGGGDGVSNAILQAIAAVQRGGGASQGSDSGSQQGG